MLATIATKYPQILYRFGGHAVAAGLSIASNHYDQFTALFEDAIQQLIHTIAPYRLLYSDGELSPEELNLQFALLLQEAGPWGQGFLEPTFEGDFQICEQRLVGSRHLQMALRYTGVPRIIKAIFFNADLTEWPNLRVRFAKVFYKLMVDEWKGRREIKLYIEALHAL